MKPDLRDASNRIAPRTVRFYFDYISHNAWLAWVGLRRMAPRELRIEPVPVLFAGLLEAHGQLGPAEIPVKARWMWKNCLRKAADLGLELRQPAFHPFNPLLALRASSLDLEPAPRDALIVGLFHAVWSEALHVSAPEVVARVASTAGLDGEAVVREAQTPAIKQRLRERTERAIAAGVFGVPSMEVEGELFWGYDDLPWLERFLAGDDPLDPALVPSPDERPRPSAVRRRFRE